PPVRPGLGQSGQVFGVYVHVPFCSRRCDYCAFATWTDRHELMVPYLSACRRSLQRAQIPAATSVFFGGGTPSLVPAELLISVLSAIETTTDAEVTVECNPETVTPDLLAVYRDGGVNRLSFGVQSMVPGTLASLGRRHDPDTVRRAVAWADAAGFAGAWNIDLIYGAAGETAEDWESTLGAVLDLGPAHVSAYALTVEAGTPLAADRARYPDDDVQADYYELADDLLGNAGLRWYEISNWAKPGSECRHNQLYWEQGDYHAVGCAAHGHSGGVRWWNVRTPERFIGLVEAGESVVAGSEQLTSEQRALEGLQLALRTRRGVPMDALPAELIDDGLIVRRGDRAVLTVRGRLLANEVAHRLVVAGGAVGAAV
ncbi:MAG TPA: radical SAM family heme chaperone HemW, partial [Acidimicrobiales bacterium]